MKQLVFGSFNIDRVYSVPHLPQAGETQYCEDFEIHVGGKGLNQAISLCYAFGSCSMAGCVGNDGEFLVDFMKDCGVDTHLVKCTDGFTGHAIIQVEPRGQNQMILFPGSNAQITEEYCLEWLEEYSAGDLLLMQCETSQTAFMLRQAKKKGLTIALNPSPYVDEIKNLPLECVDYFVLNEFEGQSLSGKEDTKDVTDALLAKYPGSKIILTLGGDGSVYADADTFVRVPAFDVKAVDTTGAGDTFTGYSLYALMNGKAPVEALTAASAASALAVQVQGAANAIPNPEQVKEFLEKAK